MKKMLLVMALCMLGTPAGAGPAHPLEIPGLEAWYDIDVLHRRMRGGEKVLGWEDASGKGHGLVFEGDSQPAIFNTQQVNDKPAVRIGRGNTYTVTRPFDLEDHTIFLVYATNSAERALFRSDTDDKRGLLLHHRGRFHQYQNGGMGRLYRYHDTTKFDKGFTITVLGREAGSLRAFLNSHELPRGVEFSEPIRVGVFFHIEASKFVGRDGEGLNIAEMLFYDRFLTEAERGSVTAYLSEKYGIDIESVPAGIEGEGRAVRAKLGTSSEVNVNDAIVAIDWDVQTQLEAPFRIDAENGNAAIYCDRDGTQAAVSVSLFLKSSVPDARVRVLILKNGEEYLPDEKISGPFEGVGDEKRSRLELKSNLSLDAGDYIEIITTQAGAAGDVLLEPGKTRLLVATLN